MKIAPSYLFIVLFFFLFVLLVYSSVLIVNNVCQLRHKNAAIKFICGLALFVLFQCLFTCLRLHARSIDDLRMLLIYSHYGGIVFPLFGAGGLYAEMSKKRPLIAICPLQYFFLGVVINLNGVLVTIQLGKF